MLFPALLEFSKAIQKVSFEELILNFVGCPDLKVLRTKVIDLPLLLMQGLAFEPVYS